MTLQESLAHVFLDARAWLPNDVARTGAPASTVGARIAALWEEARERWPTVDLPPLDFARTLRRCAATDCDPLEALDALYAVDLYLATACEAGLPQAFDAFDHTFLASVPQQVAHMGKDAAFADEVAQTVRVKQFVGGKNSGPGIATYRAKAPLAAWVKKVVRFQAFNLARRGKDPGDAGMDDGDLLDDLPAGGDLELTYLKTRYAREYREALKEAKATLPSRQHAFLRLHHRGKLSMSEIGGIYNLDHSNVSRQLEKATTAVATAARSILCERLQIDTAELESLMRLVRSQIGMSFLDDE